VRLPWLLSWWREGVVLSEVDIGKCLTFLYHSHVGHWPGKRRGEDPRSSYLPTQSNTTLPNEVFPRSAHDRLVANQVVGLACWGYLVRCPWLCNKTIAWP
jgi:hypothetical protein